jgi:hypothetical protein
MIFDKPQNLNCNQLATELEAAGIQVTGLVRNPRGIIIIDDRFFVEKNKLRFGFEVPENKVEIVKQIVQSHNAV